jgi:histone acetyltransferase (RNA polymerase elongator complex component)
LALEEFVRARVEMFDINISETKPERIYEYIDEKPKTSNLKNISETDLENQIMEKLNARFREMELGRLKNENLELQNQIDKLKKKYRKVWKFH